MIIEYLENGFIFHEIDDPLPDGMADDLRSRGRPFLVVPVGVRVDDAYVLDGALVARPTLGDISATTIPADGLTRATVEGVPAGTVVSVNGEVMGELTDTVLAFVATEPGGYEIHLEPPFPTLPATYRVTAT